MAEKSSFFDSTPTDIRKYSADAFAEYFRSLFKSGVFLDKNMDALKVTASGKSMETTLNLGVAYLEGYRYENDAPIKLVHALSDQANERKDRIVIRLDKDLRSVNAYVKPGLIGGEAPTLKRTPKIYELCVATVTIIAGKSYIESSQIADERLNQELCGIASPTHYKLHAQDHRKGGPDELTPEMIGAVGPEPIALSDNYDLNLVLDGGVYSGRKLINAPFTWDTTWIVEVARTPLNANFVIQRVADANATTPTLYVRSYHKTFGWSSWSQNFYREFVDDNLTSYGSARTYYLSPTGNGDNDGLSADKPLKSFENLIQKVPPMFVGRYDLKVIVAPNMEPYDMQGLEEFIETRRIGAVDIDFGGNTVDTNFEPTNIYVPVIFRNVIFKERVIIRKAVSVMFERCTWNYKGFQWNNFPPITAEMSKVYLYACTFELDANTANNMPIIVARDTSLIRAASSSFIGTKANTILHEANAGIIFYDGYTQSGAAPVIKQEWFGGKVYTS